MPKFASKFNDVQIGVSTYSYRSLRDLSEPWSVQNVNKLMDRVVDAIVQDGINAAEFWIAYFGPPGRDGHRSTQFPFIPRCSTFPTT